MPDACLRGTRQLSVGIAYSQLDMTFDINLHLLLTELVDKNIMEIVTSFI